MLVGVTPLLDRPVIKGDLKLKTANEWGDGCAFTNDQVYYYFGVR